MYLDYYNYCQTKKNLTNQKIEVLLLYSSYLISVYIPIYLILYFLHQAKPIQTLTKITYLYRLKRYNDPKMIGAPI